MNMNYALVLAGGRGERMGKNSVPKQFIDLSGKPLILYALETIEKNDYLSVACIVAPIEWHDRIKEWCKTYHLNKIKLYTDSGKDRQQSVHNGLKMINARKDDNVMIMTAVCPFVSQETINEHFIKMTEYNACITVVRATDAITFSNNGLHANRTLQKSKMFVQQVPQTYKYGIIKTVHEQYDLSEYKAEINEDSELVLNMGIEVAMVFGDRFCLKVTYPEDIAIVEILKSLFDAKEEKLYSTKNLKNESNN
jgi:2-C-methyl-D-erythritol 4-phosphate cytidylyltransferase